MATSLGSAQHYVECDECEENPAKFVCKSCPGHLCNECKTEHENRKITKNHEITELQTNNKDLVCLLYCADHKTKKLECFCDPCQKPVCTDCILSSHNGHAVQPLSKAFQRIRDDLKKKNEEIQHNLLPKYMELLEEENEKRLALTSQADEIEKQIEIHTQKIIKTVTETGKSTVKNLRDSEREGLLGIDKARSQIQKTIQQLHEISKDLSAKIEARPGIAHFKHVDSNLLEEFKSYPMQNNYKLYNFKPGDIQVITNNFGTRPHLQTIEIDPEERIKKVIEKARQFLKQSSQYRWNPPLMAAVLKEVEIDLRTDAEQLKRLDTDDKMTSYLNILKLDL